MNRNFFVFVLMLFSICRLGFTQNSGGMHPDVQVDFVKERITNKDAPYYSAYLQLLSQADSALVRNDHALEDFNVPGFYQEPELHRANSRSLQSDSFDAYATALAYRLSGDDSYAEKAVSFLMAWANINQQYSNYDGSLVMAYSGTGLIIAAELLSDYDGWPVSEKEKFYFWAENVYKKACDEIRGRKNNWADWGRLGSILTASLLDDRAEIRENIRLIKSDLFHKIADDGHMPEEVRREANGIWYTYFSLAPITAACWVAYQEEGVDLFHLEEEGKSLKKALDYLLYFSQNPDEWEWFDGPRVASPGLWPYNLIEAMGGIYGEEKYEAYVQGVRPLIYPTHHFAWSFPTLMKPFLDPDRYSEMD